MMIVGCNEEIAKYYATLADGDAQKGTHPVFT